MKPNHSMMKNTWKISEIYFKGVGCEGEIRVKFQLLDTLWWSSDYNFPIHPKPNFLLIEFHRIKENFCKYSHTIKTEIKNFHTNSIFTPQKKIFYRNKYRAKTFFPLNFSNRFSPLLKLARFFSSKYLWEYNTDDSKYVVHLNVERPAYKISLWTSATSWIVIQLQFVSWSFGEVNNSQTREKYLTIFFSRCQSERVNRRLGRKLHCHAPIPEPILLLKLRFEVLESMSIELRALSDKYFSSRLTTKKNSQKKSNQIQFKFQIMFDFLVKRLCAIKSVFMFSLVR